MIYSGSDATGPVTTGNDAFIGTSAFNNSNNDNAYVGYMYTIGEQHGTEKSSTIKEMIDKWYSETSGLINYEKYIDGSTGFCGDRTTTNGTIYSTYARFNSNSPSLICSNNNDLYTTSGSGQGNEALTYPIALASSDEIVFAGGYNGQNTNYYINANTFFWVMSPYEYEIDSNVFDLDYYGWLGPGTVTMNSISVRPVINLKSDVFITGSGTIDDPYETD